MFKFKIKMSRNKQTRYESGICIYSNEKYRCGVCYQRPELMDPTWKQHLATDKHRQAYENYTKYFKNDTAKGMTCKICGCTEVNWFQLENHAQSHKLKPWYFPPMRQLRLFENFMVQGKTFNYYCHICKKNFLSWWKAHEHTTDVNHLKLRRKMFPDSQLTKFNLAVSSIICYCQKRVFPLSDRMAWCWVCDEKILIANINMHCDGPSHLAAKRRALELIEENEKEKKLSLAVVDESRDNCSDKLCNNVDVDDEDKAAASQTNSSDKSKSKKSVTTTTKPPSKPVQRYACSMCNVRLVEKKHIEIHLNGSSHKNQLEIFKTKCEGKKNLSFYDLPIGIKVNEADKSSFKFKCTLCQSNVSNFFDLIAHIQSKSHLENTGKIYDGSPTPSSGDLPERIVSTKLHDVFYCALCTCIIKGAKSITEHVQGSDHQRHLNRFEKYFHKETPKVKYEIPKEHIEKARTTNEFPPEIKCIDCKDPYYWCSICKCALFQPVDHSFVENSVKIWRHVGGVHHVRNKELSAKAEKNVASKKVNLPESKVNNDSSSFIRAEKTVESTKVNLSKTELKDDHVENKNINSVTSKVATTTTEHELPQEKNEATNNDKEFPEEILFIETEESSSLWCEICKCSLYSSVDSIYNSADIWRHINSQNHRDNDVIFKKNQPVLSTESTLEIAGEEKLYCLPIEELMDVHVKDGILRAVTCKPCELYFDGELDDLAADWDRHLATQDHQQNAHFFSIEKLKLELLNKFMTRC